MFDCDGTLVDSEPLAWAAWGAVLARYGLVLTPEDVAARTGHTFADTYGWFAARGDLPAADALWRELSSDLFERFDRELAAFPDVLAVLPALEEAGLRLAVASSSPRERVERALRAVGLRGRFAAVVAGDEVARGKPAPDLFLAAAALLGVEPATCVAVEDAASGVAAARAAGMRVVGVARDPRADLSGADRVVGELTVAAITAW